MDSESKPGRARGILALAAAALALAFGARRLHAEASAPPRSPAETRAESPARAAAPAAAKPAPARVTTAVAAAAPGDNGPSSLRGTDEDGSLAADESGNLVVGPGILAFFDYHLSATGELSPSLLKARILARIHATLPERAAGQASTLLDRYLAYREATKRLREDGDSAARLAALHDLRVRIFGDDDAARLFGDQERSDAVALAEQRVHQDPSLTPEERAARLAKLEEGLPEAMRAARARAILPVREQEEEAALRAAGHSDEEIRSHRVANVGEAAADRLEALDAQRDAWKQRLQAYRAARAAIAEKISDPAAQRAAEAQLLEASFNPQERLRVAALDAIAAEAPPSAGD
jgi:lipase chaperone LimK